MPVRTTLLSLIFLVAACKTTTTPVNPNIQRPEVIQQLNQYLEEFALPGVCFSIILPDGTQETYAAGYSDKEQKIALTTNHLLLSGSIGKTYAVALLLPLVESGVLDLDKAFISYFPETEWLKRLPNIEEITLRMLLQHTSGLPRWAFKPTVWQTLHNQPDKEWTYYDRLSYIFDEPAVHPAGEGWAYSDTNYILLGMLLEKVLEEDYYTALIHTILRPNQFHQTRPSDQRRIHGLATAYSQLPAQFRIPPKVVENGLYAINPQVEWTGGGIASSTADLAKWCKGYYEAAYFPEEFLQQMTRPNANGTAVEEPHSYGMGSFIYSTNYGQAFGHTGFMPGFNSIMAYYPDKKMALALQFNCDYASGQKELISYLDELLELY